MCDSKSITSPIFEDLSSVIVLYLLVSIITIEISVLARQPYYMIIKLISEIINKSF